MRTEEIIEGIKERYGRIAREGMSRGSTAALAGYSEEQVGQAPDAAGMSLGCGNPVALAAMEAGDVVLDLGSGAGFDSFLASKAVGESGRVIGVDMTEDMIARAKANAIEGGFGNVEFRHGRIEDLPVEDGSVDVVISNCVINLSVDKGRVFREAYRALKSGGRMMVSDMVLLRELPEAVRGSVHAYAGCVAGALTKDEYLRAIREAGFDGVEVLGESSFTYDMVSADPEMADIAAKSGLTEDDLQAAVSSVVSMKVAAVKG